MSQASQRALAPPPDPSTRAPDPGDRGFPRWPLWAPVVALALGLAAGLVGTGVVAAAVQSTDRAVTADSPWFNALNSFAVDVCVVGASFFVAGMTAPPRPWQFGLRRTRLAFAVGMAAIATAAFLAFEVAYSAIVSPKNPQTIVTDLGANRSTALLVLGALVVIVVAPACEETFFRGFLFRVLRLRTGFWVAAGIDGVIFGLVHGALVIVPILAVLGIALCWVYERTGSIFPTIALHALNNTIAYGASASHAWPVAGAVGALMLAACAVVPTVLPRGGPSAA